MFLNRLEVYRSHIAPCPFVPAWFATSTPDEPDPPRETGDHENKSFEKYRILIVEDEFFVAIDTQMILEANGHSIVGIAVTADEAVALTARERPDVVLMDIRLMGSRDGIDAAREIRQRFDIPSVFVTANTDDKTRQRAEVVRPLGFLDKPFTEERLRTTLAAMRSKI
jgi:two-component system, response regulator PdtaR